MNQEEIKEQILQELNKEQINYDRVLTLSSLLSRHDPDNVRFTVDANHINRLGIELVSRQETALSEIIKNAYDADATNVELLFKQGVGGKQTLIVVDNGTGMSRNELVDGFMRISTAQKHHNPVSEVFRRKRAGKKGIGRFAAQRLGSKLTVITKRKEAEKFLVVTIDWDKFLAEEELTSISNRIEEVEKTEYEIGSSGTALIIDNLRETWTDAKIKRSYRYAADLLLPYPVSEINTSQNSDDKKEPNWSDPGFDAIFKRQELGQAPAIVADSANVYLEHAFAVIRGKIDQHGQAFWRVTSKHLDFDSGWNGFKLTTYKQYSDAEIGKYESLSFKYVRDIEFVAYYFIPNITHYPKNLTAVIQEALRDHGGIRLYRNGFRVLPYGERYNDWLHLDLFNRNRSILPPIGNNNFFGVVEISPHTQGDFEEVASREGLIENDSFLELREFVSSSIISGIVEISSQRKIKVFASQPDYVPTQKQNDFTDSEKEEFVKEKINQWKSSEYESHRKTDSPGSGERVKSEYDEKIGIDKLEFEQFAEIALELIDRTELYRVLAGLGLAMAEFTHEVQFNMLDILLRVQSLKNELHQGQKKNLDGIENRIDSLRGYTAFFENSFQSLANKHLEILDLRAIVNDFIQTMSESAFRGKGIEIEVSHQGYEFFTKPSHRSNIDSILVNLYSNAKKAIYRRSGFGKIQICLVEKPDSLEILFSDTGDGISDEIKDRIFQPFFTTNTQKVNDVSETSQMLGMGLGLAIVKEIASGLDGEVDLAQPQEGFSTTFKISLPKAEDKDIPNDMF